MSETQDAFDDLAQLDELIPRSFREALSRRLVREHDCTKAAWEARSLEERARLAITTLGLLLSESEDTLDAFRTPSLANGRVVKLDDRLELYAAVERRQQVLPVLVRLRDLWQQLPVLDILKRKESCGDDVILVQPPLLDPDYPELAVSVYDLHETREQAARALAES